MIWYRRKKELDYGLLMSAHQITDNFSQLRILLMDGHVHFTSSNTVVFNSPLSIKDNQNQGLLNQIRPPPGLSESTRIELANLNLDWHHLVHLKTQLMEINDLSKQVKAQLEDIWSNYTESELIVNDQLASWFFPEVVRWLFYNFRLFDF
jgi:hypothetical protein